MTGVQTCALPILGEQRAQNVRTFFERALTHAKGALAGQAFSLSDWQYQDIIRPLFGTLRPDGLRQYRTAYIEVPRKNGKSTLAAGIALYLLLADGRRREGVRMFHRLLLEAEGHGDGGRGEPQPQVALAASSLGIAPRTRRPPEHRGLAGRERRSHEHEHADDVERRGVEPHVRAVAEDRPEEQVARPDEEGHEDERHREIGRAHV